MKLIYSRDSEFDVTTTNNVRSYRIHVEAHFEASFARVVGAILLALGQAVVHIRLGRERLVVETQRPLMKNERDALREFCHNNDLRPENF